MNKTTQEKLAKLNGKYGFNKEKTSKLVMSSKPIKSSSNSKLTKEMIMCKSEIDMVLDRHYKTFNVTIINDDNTIDETQVRGFLDKHPRDKDKYCIRVFNIFAPRDEPKLKASTYLELIEQVSKS